MDNENRTWFRFAAPLSSGHWGFRRIRSFSFHIIFHSFEAGNCVSNSSFKWMKNTQKQFSSIRVKLLWYDFIDRIRRLYKLWPFPTLSLITCVLEMKSTDNVDSSPVNGCLSKMLLMENWMRTKIKSEFVYQQFVPDL